MNSDFKIKVEKITGLVDEKYATGIFSKRVSPGNDIVATLVGCFIVAAEGGDAGIVLHELFDLFANKFEQGQESILARMEVACETVKSRVEELGYEGSFVVCLYFKVACYVARYKNKVKIFVYRAPNSSEIKFASGSGKLIGGEIFVLGTEKFFSTFNVDIFTQEGEVDLEGIIDGLATDISADAQQSQIAAAFVKVGKDVVVEEEMKTEELLESIHKDKNQEDEALVEQAAEKEEPERTEPIEIISAHGGKTETDAEAPGQFNIGHSPANGSNPLAAVSGLVLREVKRLKKGDIGAIFRLRRNIVILAVFVLGILAISGFLTISSQINNKKTAEFKVHMDLAGGKYTEAVSILDLNRTRARSILVEAQKEVGSALVLRPKDVNAQNLKSQIEAKLKESESHAGVDFKTFYEAGGNVVTLAKSADSMLVFSSSQVVEVDKSAKVLKTFGDFTNISAGSVYDKNLFIFSSGKVSKLKDTRGSLTDVGQAPDGQDLGLFAGNAYVLGKNQIHKFVPVESGYSKSADYLEQSEEFGANSRMAIDGSVWVTKGGAILKYTRGKKDDFNISGLVGASSDFGEIYTDSDLDNVYVVDRANSAILVIGKDGNYLRSYQSDKLAQAMGVLVDEKLGKIYIASGNRVLVADLVK